jgi:hypothetical protein
MVNIRKANKLPREHLGAGRPWPKLEHKRGFDKKPIMFKILLELLDPA